VDVVIPADAPIPARKAVTYHSNRPDQARMVYEVVQVRKPAGEPTSLGHFAFGLERPRKNHPLEVTLGYDELGLVTVQARDPDTGREVRQEFGDPAAPGSDRLHAQAELVGNVRLVE
jgi:molecular chaperone DnaK